MPGTPAPPVVITRIGTEAATRRKLFVNLPVADLQRSVRFFEALGFAFNPHFTTAQAVCMPIGTDAYAMLLARERFADLTAEPIVDPRAATHALFAFSVDSRKAVDATVETALAAGGSPAGALQDLGFMANRCFSDLDGHVWEVFWMDPAAAG